MRLSRKFLTIGITVVVFLGGILASDPRFIPRANPVLIAFIFGPTILFAVIAVVKWRNGLIWPAAAFAVGLMFTGLFHQMVAGETYGNPGYMFAGLHIVAPLVSLAAYLLSFLSSWIVVWSAHKLGRARSGD